MTGKDVGLNALARLRAKGVDVRLGANDRIVVKPVDAVTQEMRTWIDKHRDKVVAALKFEIDLDRPPAPAPPPADLPIAPKADAGPGSGPPNLERGRDAVHFRVTGKPTPYTQVPNALFDLPARLGLAQSTAHVLFQLARMTYGYHGADWEGPLKELARACACERKTVYRAIAELERAGVARVDRRRDHHGRYVPATIELTLDPPEAPAG